jgi:uncharacterized HAD superfamily protein
MKVKLDPSLGIDLDGCVDEAPIFFSTLTHSWPGKVVVITYRDDRGKAEQFLKQHNIRWDELILVNSFDEKAKVIEEKGIGIYFDDQPEMLKDIPQGVAVMLVRNEGNYDFDTKKWMFSKNTGKIT